MLAAPRMLLGLDVVKREMNGPRHAGSAAAAPYPLDIHITCAILLFETKEICAIRKQSSNSDRRFESLTAGWK